jgi:hypothetical protein
MTDRKKPGIAFWATVVIAVAFVGYPLSIGPACWVSSRANCGAATVSVVYRPLACGMPRSERFTDVVSWYSELAAAHEWGWSNGTWSKVERDTIGRWLYSPKARAINRGLGFED